MFIILLNKLVIVMFNYNVSLHELPSENRVLMLYVMSASTRSVSGLYLSDHS